MGLVRLQQYGHTPIALVGGGTGMIGDPSGKTLERQLLSKEQIERNLEGIREQLSHFLDFAAPIRLANDASASSFAQARRNENARLNAAMLVNNADWLT